MALVYKKRVDFWEEMMGLAAYFKDEIRFTADSAGRIFERYLATRKEKNIREISLDRPFADGFWQTVKPATVQLGLAREDCQILQMFADGLGVSDVEGQMNHCERYGNLFSARSQRCAAEYASKGKLYRSLGWLSAVTVAVLVM